MTHSICKFHLSHRFKAQSQECPSHCHLLMLFVGSNCSACVMADQSLPRVLAIRCRGLLVNMSGSQNLWIHLLTFAGLLKGYDRAYGWKDTQGILEECNLHAIFWCLTLQEPFHIQLFTSSLNLVLWVFLEISYV